MDIDPAVLWLIALTPAGLGALALMLRMLAQSRRDRSRVTLALRFPADLPFDRVVGLLRALAGLLPARPIGASPSVVFETVARPGRIEHRLRVPADRVQPVLRQLYAAVPGVLAEPIEDAELNLRWGRALRQTGRGLPLRTDQPDQAAAAVLAGLQPLAPGETVVLQWVCAASRYPPLPPTRTTASAPQGRLGLLRRIADGPPPPSGPQARHKAAEPLFAVTGRVGVGAAERRRGVGLLRRATALLHPLHGPGAALVWRRPASLTLTAKHTANASTPITGPGFGARLNAAELAAVIAWPLDAPALPGLPPPAARRLPPSPETPAHDRVIGVASFPGQQRPIALPAVQALAHTHVIGPTGVGKSTLLGNLVCQDIAAGRGVVVIDPKGDLVSDVADRIPDDQHHRVIVLDPTDDQRPVGLNLLHGAHRAPELAADQVLAIFHRLYAAFWGPRTQDILHASLLTLAQEPGMTLCELPLLLTHDGFRRRLVARVDDPVALGPFWAWYEALTPAQRGQAIGPVMNKLRAFLLRRRVRNLLGQTQPAFTLNQVLAEPKVLLVSLAKGQLGAEAAALIGSLAVALLWQAAQQRGSNRAPVMVYIDEFQDVLNLPTDLADVLAQARGFGIGLTLAHQHLGQLSPSVRQAVTANARSKIVFQAAAEDAPALARHLGAPLTAADLQTLPAREVYAALAVGGQVTAPVSVATRPLPDPLGSAAAIRQRSRERYGRPRAEIETAIQARRDPQHGDEGAVGREPRAQPPL